MSSQTTRRPFRAALVAFALLLTSTLAASANPLVPAESAGGPGGGRGGPAKDEVPTLVGSDEPREYVLGEEVPTLVGSTFTRETVYVPDTTIAVSGEDDTLTPATADFEDIQVAQHEALAVAELEAATHPNARSIRDVEGKTPVALAGGNELAQARQAKGSGTTPF